MKTSEIIVGILALCAGILLCAKYFLQLLFYNRIKYKANELLPHFESMKNNISESIYILYNTHKYPYSNYKKFFRVLNYLFMISIIFVLLAIIIFLFYIYKIQEWISQSSVFYCLLFYYL
jgi:hypothetical protein